MDKKKSPAKPGASAKTTRVAVKKTAGSSKKTAAKAPAAKAASETTKLTKASAGKETAKGKIPAKTKAKTAGSKTELKKTPVKKPAKSADTGKAVTPEKRQVKKSPAKTVVSKTKPASEKTVKAVKPKEAALVKHGKGVVKKPEVKAARGVKVAAKAEAAPKKEKKITEKELKAVPERKSAVKKSVATTKKSAGERLKPKQKAETPLAAARKGVKKRIKAPAFKGLIKTKEIQKKTAAVSAVSPRREIKPKRSFDLHVFLPEEEFPEEEPLILPPSALPEEYGENELLLMEVDPSRVFASWEIKPEDIAKEAGKLVLRVYDVTGIDSEKVQSCSFFDIPIRQRVGSKFFDIKMPGREVIMAIGLLSPEGSFKAIERSHRVSMPSLQTFEEFWIYISPEDLKKPVGY